MYPKIYFQKKSPQYPRKKAATLRQCAAFEYVLSHLKPSIKNINL
jgi:hypothetical protein